MHESIFKAYDVRGRYPGEFDEAGAERIGRAAAHFFNAHTIAVGIDHRASSPSLRDALIRGITAGGVDVVDVGRVTTPCAYFASHHLDMPTIMVTASHNPPEYNGMKFCLPHAIPVGGDSGLKDIRDLAMQNDLTVSSTPGKVSKHPVTQAFHDFLRSKDTLTKDFRVALDTASAVGIEDLPLWRSLPHIEVIASLYDSYAVPCPHEANPMKPETLTELGESVRNSHADIGIGYDGDADRIGILDEHGVPIRADLITALIGRELLRSNPDATILADVRSSLAVKEVIEEAGGKFHFVPSGHAKIKAILREAGAVFAGELSNHFYYADPYAAEMGALPVLHLLAIVERTGKSLSTLVGELPAYAHSGEINFTIPDPKGALTVAKEAYKRGVANNLDGIRVDFPDWWFSLRASNTEPLLRLNLETKTRAETDAKVSELSALIATLGGKRVS